MGKVKFLRVPIYIIKTADIYKYIVYMSENIEDIANYLKTKVENIIPVINKPNKIGNYRIGLINLKYTKEELLKNQPKKKRKTIY